MEPIDPAVHVLVAVDIDEDRGGGLAAGDHGRVVKQPHIVAVAGSSDEGHRVPGDGRKLGRIEADRAVERLVVLDVELQFQAGEIGPLQVLQPQVVEVVVGVPPAQDREIFGSLEDPRDGHTGVGGVVDRGGRGAPGEALATGSYGAGRSYEAARRARARLRLGPTAVGSATDSVSTHRWVRRATCAARF